MLKNDLPSLIEISRRYGSDSRMVLLGGGNTSVKDETVMYVKASGHALDGIDESGFVAMSIPRLMSIWDKEYPENPEEREKEVLADMMSSRLQGESGRPSVEALLHAIIPFKYVIHMHPAMVNGLTCSQSGKVSMEKLFGDALWIPLVNPGYILAKTVREAQKIYKESNNRDASLIFLQNHGVFVGANSEEEIDKLYKKVMDTIGKSVVRKPAFTEVKVDSAKVELIQQALKKYFNRDEDLLLVANKEILNRLTDESTFLPISSAFTPDHIVYSGFKPLWIAQSILEEVDPMSAIIKKIEEYVSQYSVEPKIVAVQQTAAFALNESALLLFLDSVKVATFTESFGGPRFMDEDQIEFIRNWEVESYRSKLLENK